MKLRRKMLSIVTKTLHALSEEVGIALNDKYLVQSVSKEDKSGYQVLYVYDQEGKEAFFHSMRKHRALDSIKGDSLRFANNDNAFNLVTRQWEKSSNPPEPSITFPEGYELYQGTGPFFILRSKDDKFVVYLSPEKIIPIPINPLSEIYSLGREAFLLHSGFEELSFLYNKQGEVIHNWYGHGMLIAAESSDEWLSFVFLHEGEYRGKLEWVRVYRR